LYSTQRRSAYTENTRAGTAASWLSGGLFQRQVVLQAAPCCDQPRAISRFGRITAGTQATAALPSTCAAHLDRGGIDAAPSLCLRREGHVDHSHLLAGKCADRSRQGAHWPSTVHRAGRHPIVARTFLAAAAVKISRARVKSFAFIDLAISTSAATVGPELASLPSI